MTSPKCTVVWQLVDSIAIVAGLLLQYPLVLLAMPILVGWADRNAPSKET